MKKIIFASLLAIAFSTSAFAASTSLSLTANVNSPPITAQKDQDLTAQVFKTNGKTSYVDTDTEWVTSKVAPAKMQATGDTGAVFQINVPASITLTNGADTATVALDCRLLNTGYPTNKSDGTACGTSGTSHGGTGKIYLAVFPTGVDFSANNANGTYTGSVPADINY